MLKTKNQSRVSISGLTYNNLIEDAYNALKDSDAFKNNFQDFTSNTAERMIVELYAYMATQLANRLDQMGNELFVDTASASGMSRLLKLVGARVEFPAAATVEVSVTTSSNTNEISLTTGIDNGLELGYVSGAFKSVTANNGTNWEFIEYKVGNDGEYVYDYTTRYNFTAPSRTYTLCEGSTHALEYTIRSVDTDIITLSASPVIRNSVRVYYKQKVKKAGSEDYEISEFKKVDNFFTTEALTSNVGVFTERNMGNGKCEICLKPFSSDTESDLGKELLIMYRTGGGEDGNVSIGAIDKTERFQILGESARTTGYGLLNIYNTSTGIGGKDELTTDQIRATVLQEVRNTKIAVTEEDYEYLLPKYDSKIELIKCYGEKLSDIAALAETYGYYVNPITVWLIILKYNKEFYDAYMEDVEGLTDRINDISFSTLDVNPRFNEKYQINKAYLNQTYKVVNFSNYYNAENGSYSFPIDPEGIEILKSGGCQITVTNYPYIESSSTSRRGVNCFRKYDELTGEKTWAQLLALTSASVGDVYLITDACPDDEANSRWECIQEVTQAINPEDYEMYWRKVDFSYVYDNLISDNISDDRMYIQQQSANVTQFAPVYSYIGSSFSGNWEELRENETWKYGEEGIKIPSQITLTINGTDIILETNTEFSTPQEFCDAINSRMVAKTNAIILKENVTPNLSDNPNNVELENKTVTSTRFWLEEQGITSDVTLDLGSATTTYGALVEVLNSYFENNNSSYKAVWLKNNGCWDLALICKYPFTYQDNASSLEAEEALYVDILNNPAPDSWPLNSSELELTTDQANEFSDFVYYEAGDTIATYKDGEIILGFDEEGSCSILIDGGTDAQTLRAFFGLKYDETKAVSTLNRRTFNVSLVSGDSEQAYLQVQMLNSFDMLNEDIYINIFGGLNGRIKLGEYYENISKYLTDVPTVVTDLLKRGPIKHLYSTSYITDNYKNIVDRYGSDYQVKLSTGLIEEQTFNQLSSGNSPAKITTVRTATTSTPYYGADSSKLYMKVDNIEYDGTGSFEVNGQTFTVGALNGYAEFDLSWFNGCNTGEFVTAIVNVFSKQGEGDTPLLQKADTLESVLAIYTMSSAFYSSIDFGSTPVSIITDLFGITDSVIHSREGQIETNQIKYQYYPLTEFLAITSNLKITITKDDSITVADVNTGYSITDFTNNIAQSAVKDYVIVNNNRIILTDLTNGTKIKIKVEWEDELQKLSWENMFTKEIWDLFIKGTNFAELELVNNGDYYIELDDDGNYYFVVQNKDTFPFGDIYFHMYEDYSIDHIVSENEENNTVVYTDEYNWNSLMSDRKVMIAEHVYKQPRFIPFDLAITCTLPNTETYSQTDYQAEIANYLRNEYGLYSDNMGEEIIPDDIISNIKNEFAKVLKVKVDYLGYEISNQATNKESLTTEFNQKHILASTKVSSGMVVDPETGFITFQENITVHGLKIALKYRAS